jgi:hypothetical protein
MNRQSRSHLLVPVVVGCLVAGLILFRHSDLAVLE